MRRRVYAEDDVVLAAGPCLQLLHDVLVVVLAPREYVLPVGQVVGDDGQPVAPRLDDRLDVVQRRLRQALVDLERLLQLHDLLRGLQERQVDVADDVRQAAPLVQAQHGGRLDVPFRHLERLVLRIADEVVASEQRHLKDK